MRFYQQQHRFYCGVDLHARTMYLCIVDQAGAVLFQRNLAAEASAFLHAVAPFRDGLVVGRECMFAWYWLADLCGQEEILGPTLGPSLLWSPYAIDPDRVRLDRAFRAGSLTQGWHRRAWQRNAGGRPLAEPSTNWDSGDLVVARGSDIAVSPAASSPSALPGRPRGTEEFPGRVRLRHGARGWTQRRSPRPKASAADPACVWRRLERSLSAASADAVIANDSAADESVRTAKRLKSHDGK